MQNIDNNGNSILSELKPFFYPSSLAVAGVSSDPTKFGSILFRAIRDFGYTGPMYPVNPKLNELDGYICI